ncbi:MAG: ABC transporter ATP-binding protein [Patescibacteria group bacterium]
MFQKGIRAFCQLFSTFVREFIFVFRVAPKQGVALTFLQFLIGVIPALELYIGSQIIDELTSLLGGGVWSQRLSLLVLFGLALLGLQRVIFSFNDYLTKYLRSFLNLAVNDRIHRMVLQLDLPTIERSSVHTLVTYLKDQSWRPMQMVYTGFQTLGNIVASVAYIVLAATFSPFFTTLFLIAVLPSLILSVWAVYSGSKVAWGKASLMKQVWYFQSLFRYRRSLIELTIHNVGTYFADRYKTLFGEVISKEMDIEKKRLGASALTNLGAFVVYVMVYLQIIRSVLVGASTIGQFTLYVGAFVSLERFLVSQVWQLAMLLEHTKYLDSFRELEMLSPTIGDARDAVELGLIKIIDFRDVSYTYPQSTRPALLHVSFVLREGERMALVGENGAGKSTLVKLLLRLYEPSQGQIFINGRDYREYRLVSLRKQIGVTFQDFLEFSLSVKENIAVGELAYLEDSRMIEQAAMASGIHERIAQLPKQYSTILGHEFHEDGIELSGGEWQKIALARSLIKDASLLILDEPTAALDARSEYQFFQELFRRAKKQTVLVISHRFSSVRIADRILVFKDGSLIEEGKHEELMNKKGLYEELFTLQTKEVK